MQTSSGSTCITWFSAKWNTSWGSSNCFDSIDFNLILSTALRTSGAAGPSGLDAHPWQRLCTAFKTASNTLWQSMAAVARWLCYSFVYPQGIAPSLASRLIALNKCPGVHPIGIGETARRIISKAILVVTRRDIQDAAGSIQLCAGQLSGCGASVHPIREAFLKDDTEAALFVDAAMPLTPSIGCRPYIHNIRHYVHQFQRSSLTVTGLKPTSSMRMTLSSHRKESHR